MWIRNLLPLSWSEVGTGFIFSPGSILPLMQKRRGANSCSPSSKVFPLETFEEIRKQEERNETQKEPVYRIALHDPVCCCREFADVPGFCHSASLDEVRKHGHILTPGRYVEAEAAEDDAEQFEEKMNRLTATLHEQQAEAAKLDVAIAANLMELGYGR